MPDKIDDLIPKASDIQKQAALKEAEKADEYARRAAAARSRKGSLDRPAEQAIGAHRGRKGQAGLDRDPTRRAERTDRGSGLPLPEHAVHRQGRAINQMEAGWEKTLTGIPKEIFHLWADYLQPRGYRIRYQIIDFPGGVPGDIGIVISWGD